MALKKLGDMKLPITLTLRDWNIIFNAAFKYHQTSEICLDPDLQDPKQLIKYLAPYPDKEMDAFEITKLVNSSKNNLPDVLKPVK